ncbi:hypothetical protein ABZ845_04320 [Streptomyces sp. NPDC047022]|uniref:hypothetical protein n=1 Tax=Streptomyces sp. NPDC047022 TaxID=3155737 RepID=UPI0034014828
MNSTVRRACTALSLAAVLTAGTGAGVAFAADPTSSDGSPVEVGTAAPLAADPSDTGLVDVPADQVDTEPDIPGGTGTSGNSPKGQICDYATVYTPSSKGADYMSVVGAAQANTNGTSHSATSTFTAEVGGTVGVSYSGSLSTSVSVMITKIEAKFDVTLSASMTAKMGNSMSATTPAHKTTHAQYGVYRLRNQGISYRVYSNCQTSAKSTVTSYTPDYVGWHIWES